MLHNYLVFFFQAEDGIRDVAVTGVQTCALPILYRKCAKICNNSNNEPVSTNELLQNLAHFLYIFCTISVQFPYGAHFLYVFCMFSVRSFFIGGVMQFHINIPFIKFYISGIYSVCNF